MIDNNILAAYVGGQMEIQNERESYVYRGEVGTIKIEENEIRVRFAWLAKGEGFPPRKWTNDKRLDYAASLEIYTVTNIGPGEEGSDRLCFDSSFIGETAVLFPPNGSKLDPAKVEGLELAAK